MRRMESKNQSEPCQYDIELRQFRIIESFYLIRSIFFSLAEYLDLHDNNLTGSMPKEVCDLKLDTLIADCHGTFPEVKCDCCTVCCEGLPKLACFDPKTGQQVNLAL